MRSVIYLCLLLLSSCARLKLPSVEEALLPSSAPELSDDLGLDDLLLATQKQRDFMAKKDQSLMLRFGSRQISRDNYIAALDRFSSILNDKTSLQEKWRKIEAEFEFLEVYGDKRPGDVFITGYFEPVIAGALKPTARFSQALYAKPSELVSLDLAKFSEKFKEERKYRGRLVGNEFLPYFSRAEIDGGAALSGRGLELCYVDPIDAFFLQIQGSGIVQLENGVSLRLNFAEKNGHSYVAIGALLKDKITNITMLNLEAYLKDLLGKGNLIELRRILDSNPSYVFFKLSQKNAVTASGIEAIAGRSIATDPKYFPKGALAFISFEKPKIAAFNNEAQGFTLASRFVFDHDTGGAITGSGRVDLFFGRGEQAKREAAVMKGRGTLYYLFPRQQ